MSSVLRQHCLEEVSRRIVALDFGRPTRVGIDGVDASGKTTLADELAASLRALGRPVVRASIDGFHRPRAERYRLGRQSPEGYFLDSFDLAAVIDCVLSPLGPGGTRKVQRAIFDYRVDAPVAVPIEVVAPDAILLFDGVFLHRPELRPHWDATLFLDVPFEITIVRAAKRDGWPPSVDAPENHRYIEGQRIYLREYRPSEIASLVVANADLTTPRITAIRRPFWTPSDHEQSWSHRATSA